MTRRKSRAMLYYLASHAQPVRREHLLNFFWPDLSRPAAKQVLRSTFYGLRPASPGFSHLLFSSGL